MCIVKIFFHTPDGFFCVISCHISVLFSTQIVEVGKVNDHSSQFRQKEFCVFKSNSIVIFCHSNCCTNDFFGGRGFCNDAFRFGFPVNALGCHKRIPIGFGEHFFTQCNQFFAADRTGFGVAYFHNAFFGDSGIQQNFADGFRLFRLGNVFFADNSNHIIKGKNVFHQRKVTFCDPCAVALNEIPHQMDVFVHIHIVLTVGDKLLHLGAEVSFSLSQLQTAGIPQTDIFVFVTVKVNAAGLAVSDPGLGNDLIAENGVNQRCFSASGISGKQNIGAFAVGCSCFKSFSFGFHVFHKRPPLVVGIVFWNLYIFLFKQVFQYPFKLFCLTVADLHALKKSGIFRNREHLDPAGIDLPQIGNDIGDFLTVFILQFQNIVFVSSVSKIFQNRLRNFQIKVFCGLKFTPQFP